VEIWCATATHAEPIPDGAFEDLAAAVTPAGLITELFVAWAPDGYRTIGRIEVRYNTADGMALGEVAFVDVPAELTPRAWARIDERDLIYYATMDGDTDCRQEAGQLSIIGKMSVLPSGSTPGEPPITTSDYLFGLTNSRHGTDEIGLLVHGETPPTEIHVWVRGIAPGGVLGPISYFIQPSND
jgi:hypothetical protein